MKRLIALTLLAACTSQSAFEDHASRMIGMTEEQLVARLGPETRSQMAGDMKLLTWEKGYVVPYYYDSIFAGNAIITSPRGGGIVRCELTYRLEKQELIDMRTPAETSETGFVVISYRYEGNGCRA